MFSQPCRMFWCFGYVLNLAWRLTIKGQDYHCFANYMRDLKSHEVIFDLSLLRPSSTFGVMRTGPPFVPC